MGVVPQAVRRGGGPNKFCWVDVGALPGQHADANPHRLERKMHQILARNIGMHPSRGIEVTADYFESERWRKQDSQCLVGVAPEIPWPFVDRKGEMRRVKRQTA